MDSFSLPAIWSAISSEASKKRTNQRETVQQNLQWLEEEIEKLQKKFVSNKRMKLESQEPQEATREAMNQPEPQMEDEHDEVKTAEEAIQQPQNSPVEEKEPVESASVSVSVPLEPLAASSEAESELVQPSYNSQIRVSNELTPISSSAVTTPVASAPVSSSVLSTSSSSTSASFTVPSVNSVESTPSISASAASTGVSAKEWVRRIQEKNKQNKELKQIKEQQAKMASVTQTPSLAQPRQNSAGSEQHNSSFQQSAPIQAPIIAPILASSSASISPSNGSVFRSAPAAAAPALQSFNQVHTPSQNQVSIATPPVSVSTPVSLPAVTPASLPTSTVTLSASVPAPAVLAPATAAISAPAPASLSSISSVSRVSQASSASASASSAIRPSPLLTLSSILAEYEEDEEPKKNPTATAKEMDKQEINKIDTPQAAAVSAQPQSQQPVSASVSTPSAVSLSAVLPSSSSSVSSATSESDSPQPSPTPAASSTPVQALPPSQTTPLPAAAAPASGSSAAGLKSPGFLSRLAQPISSLIWGARTASNPALVTPLQAPVNSNYTPAAASASAALSTIAKSTPSSESEDSSAAAKAALRDKWAASAKQQLEKLQEAKTLVVDQKSQMQGEQEPKLADAENNAPAQTSIAAKTANAAAAAVAKPGEDKMDRIKALKLAEEQAKKAKMLELQKKQEEAEKRRKLLIEEERKRKAMGERKPVEIAKPKPLVAAPPAAELQKKLIKPATMAAPGQTTVAPSIKPATMLAAAPKPAVMAASVSSQSQADKPFEIPSLPAASDSIDSDAGLEFLSADEPGLIDDEFFPPPVQVDSHAEQPAPNASSSSSAAHFPILNSFSSPMRMPNFPAPPAAASVLKPLQPIAAPALSPRNLHAPGHFQSFAAPLSPKTPINVKSPILKAPMGLSSANANGSHSYVSPSNRSIIVQGNENNYEMSDREDSDWSDDENDTPKKLIPGWARDPLLSSALERQHQSRVDPDSIFGVLDPNSNVLNDLFNYYKKKKRIRDRTSSGNWQADKLSTREELAYKRQMGYI